MLKNMQSGIETYNEESVLERGASINQRLCSNLLLRSVSLLVGVIITLSTYTQNVCNNRILQSIANQVPEVTQEKVLEKGEFFVPRINAKRPIVVECNQEGLINHIGFKLFDRDIMEKHSTPIYLFLERYMLQLLLMETNEEIYTRLKMDRVKITSEIYPEAPLKVGLQKIISDDTSKSSVYITCNGKNYTVSCIEDEKVIIQITFPVRHELITGFTKLESEATFYSQMLTEIADSMSAPQPVLTEYDLVPYKEEYLSTYEEFYMLETITSTSYYEKVNDEYRPLFTRKYLAESIYNIFNAHHDLGVAAEVTQSLYGGKKMNFEVPINQLTAYLHHQGCMIYTGIKETEGDTVNGTVLAVNAELGYQHMLIFSVDKHIIDSPSEHTVKIKLYCYIPIHNIASLFGS